MGRRSWFPLKRGDSILVDLEAALNRSERVDRHKSLPTFARGDDDEIVARSSAHVGAGGH